MGLTEEQYQQLLRNGRQKALAPSGATNAPKTAKRAKYGNKAVLVDFGPAGEIVGGKLRLLHTFDSHREAAYYHQLTLRRAAGEIARLELQRPYALIAHVQGGTPKIIGYYEADFVFDELGIFSKRERIVDVKGMKTQVYALKKRIVEACWGITIEEIV